MRHFIIFVQILVIVCSAALKDYGRDPDDYNEDESHSLSQSESNEVGTGIYSLKIDSAAMDVKATEEPEVYNTEALIVALTEKSPERTPEEAPEKSPEKAPEKTPAEAPEKTLEEAPEKTPAEAPEKTPEEAPEMSIETFYEKFTEYNMTKANNIPIEEAKSHKIDDAKFHEKTHDKAHEAHKNNPEHDNATREHSSDSLHHAADKVKSEHPSSTTLINYPFAVSVQRKGAHYSTGALIDKRWILSSAGEFFNVRETIKLFRARLGSVDCKRGGTLIPLKRVEIHPSYVNGQPNYDLSLLMMAKPVDYTDFIRPIGFTTITTKVLSAKFMTTYWPRLIVKGQPLPTTAQERLKQNSMRVSTQRLIPREKCVTQMHQNTTLDESTLCLKPFVTHHSACLPDAGAPVVAEDGLWGITSGWIGPDCLANPSPTVFSRVSSAVVRSWLDTQMLNIV